MKTNGKPGLRSGPNTAAPAVQDPTQQAIEALGGSAGMTRTDTGYSTAIDVRRPRDLKQIIDDVVLEAGYAGEDFIYTWEVTDKNSKTGKSRIEGVSIDGAMILLRNWGNTACPIRLEAETPTHYLFEATFIDLEKGFTYARLYRQRKSGMQSKMDAERREDMAFQIGQSKAQRNVIVKGIPGWLQTRAVEAAKSNAAAKYADVPLHLPKVRDYAAGLGVSDAQLIERVGKPFQAWTSYDIVLIRIAFRAIADHTSSVEDEFPVIEAAPAIPAPATPESASTVVTTTGAVVEVPAKSEPKPVHTAVNRTEEAEAREAAEAERALTAAAVEQSRQAAQAATKAARMPGAGEDPFTPPDFTKEG